MSIRVGEDLHRRIEDAAEGAGISVSEWTRRLLVSSMGLDETNDWGAPTTLSMRERQQLSLLHQLAERVSIDEYDTAYHATMVRVLQRGYTGEYLEEFAAIDEELPMSECRIVKDILDMFRVIMVSVDKIGADSVRQNDDLAEHLLSFRGFDFNDPREGRLASYAAHLIEMGRWSELAKCFDDEHEGGNSHMPVLSSYLRMLDEFQPIWAEMIGGIGRGRYALDEAELCRVIRAA